MAKTPANHREPWTPKDVREMKRLATGNTPTRVIALKLGRTPAAIYQKASQSGISVSPTNQSPYGTKKKT